MCLTCKPRVFPGNMALDKTDPGRKERHELRREGRRRGERKDWKRGRKEGRRAKESREMGPSWGGGEDKGQGTGRGGRDRRTFFCLGAQAGPRSSGEMKLVT